MKNSFTDENHIAYHGNVKLELKEAITTADIVAGGLTTMNDGKVLQTGGMIYVDARGDKNQKLLIARNEKIGVSIPTINKMDDMMVYTGEVDSASSQINWTNPKDIIVKAVPINAADTLTPNTLPVNTVYYPQVVAPVKPKEYDKKTDTVLSLVFDTVSFPELAPYRNVKFKVLDTKNFRKTDSQIAWMDVELKQTQKEEMYDIIFRTVLAGVDVKKEYKVSPVFEKGADYATAIKEYNKKYDKFLQKKTEIEEKRKEEERKQLLLIQEMQKKAEDEMKMAKQATNDLEYLFDIKNTGWVNCDRLFDYPDLITTKTAAVIENINDYNQVYATMFLINEKINLRGYNSGDAEGEFHFGMPLQLPEGAAAIVFAFGFKDGKAFYAMKKIRISSEEQVKLVLGTCTIQNVKSFL